MQTLGELRMRGNVFSMTGACINAIYVGPLGHADDLRSIIALLEQQAFVVKRFTEDNGLQLNMEKLEFLQNSSITPGVVSLKVADTTISSSSNAICLGVAWSHDLSPTITNNMWPRLDEPFLHSMPTALPMENKPIDIA